MSYQSKKESWKEALANTAVSFIGTLIAQGIIFPLIGLDASWGQLWSTALIFALLNTVKTYFVRRYFIWMKLKRNNNFGQDPKDLGQNT